MFLAWPQPTAGFFSVNVDLIPRGDGLNHWPTSSGAKPKWFNQLATSATFGAGHAPASGPTLTHDTHDLARSFKVDFPVLPAARAATGTLSQPWELSYLTPPAGLAANLVAATSVAGWRGNRCVSHGAVIGCGVP